MPHTWGVSELQRIADSLGGQLERAVAIEDTRMRLQAHNAHRGQVDDMRIVSILERQPPPEGVAWVRSFPIETAQEPIRLPANDELDILPRLCAPIRCQGLLLGYLWIIDPDESLTEDDVAVVEAAAKEAGIVLYRERLLHELERAQERELFRDLLVDEETVRQQAARALLDRDVFAASEGVAVAVVRLPDGSGGGEDVRLALEQALEEVRRSLPPRRVLTLVRPDHSVLLVDANDVGVKARGVWPLAARLRECTIQRVGQDLQVWAGVGGIGDLEHAEQSYRQARLAARVASLVPQFAGVADWGELGIYRILAQLPPEELNEQALHPGLLRLFAADPDGVLVQTLECYLDNGCDTSATAAALIVHRSSLHYRLNRIQQLGEVELRDGEDRLGLHLGLKMARLAGLHPLAGKA